MAVSSMTTSALRRAMAGNSVAQKVAFNGARTYASKTAVSLNNSIIHLEAPMS